MVSDKGYDQCCLKQLLHIFLLVKRVRDELSIQKQTKLVEKVSIVAAFQGIPLPILS